MRKRKFSKHFDKAHSIMFSGMPSEYTKILGVPGVFVKKINRMVHLKDGTGGEMDSAYIADPDYKLLFERVAVALEHQSKPVGDEKLEKIAGLSKQDARDKLMKMTENDIKKLSRGELLEILVEQTKEREIEKEQFAQLQEKMKSREIKLSQAGSIAEAALQLNGVFEAAQEAAKQYLENIERVSAEQDSITKKIEEEARASITIKNLGLTFSTKLLIIS